MKNFFKKISEFLFGRKDALSEPCSDVYKRLEEVKNSYKEINENVINMSKQISDEEFRSLSIEQQKAVLKEELNTKNIEYTNTETGETIIGEAGKIPTLGHGIYVAKTIIPETKLDIEFFDPQDNKKEIKLNEKKSSEIKKKRGPYKKKKK